MNKYWIVEFRFPIEITKADGVDDAARIASRMMENQFGFSPQNWFARVFEYDPTITVDGPLSEWFYNPQGSKSFEIAHHEGYDLHETPIRKQGDYENSES